jgi:hypothetical protein
MEDFLKSIGLNKEYTFYLSNSKKEIMDSLINMVDKDRLDFLDIFSSNKMRYKGEVGYDSFKIKRKKMLFEKRMKASIIDGYVYEVSGQTEIKLNVHIRRWIFIYCTIVLLIAFIAIPFLFITAGAEDKFVSVFPLFAGIFMIGMFYFIFYRDVRVEAKEFEKEIKAKLYK